MSLSLSLSFWPYVKIFAILYAISYDFNYMYYMYYMCVVCMTKQIILIACRTCSIASESLIPSNTIQWLEDFDCFCMSLKSELKSNKCKKHKCLLKKKERDSHWSMLFMWAVSISIPSNAYHYRFLVSNLCEQKYIKSNGKKTTTSTQNARRKYPKVYVFQAILRLFCSVYLLFSISGGKPKRKKCIVQLKDFYAP